MISVAVMIIEAGADTEVKTVVEGETPLFMACRHGGDDNITIVKSLVEHGAGQTPLDVIMNLR